MRADHIIFMGYSLPSDDVEYRAFFSARRQRQRRVCCTIVGKHGSHPGWYGPDGLASLGYLKLQVVEAARDIFGKDNIRFYGGGIPDVFLDRGGQITAEKHTLALEAHPAIPTSSSVRSCGTPASAPTTVRRKADLP